VAFVTRTVTVAATATMVDIREGSAVDSATERGNRAPQDSTGMSLEVTVPAGGQTVYIGGSDVTAGGATQGRAVAAGSSFAVDLEPRERAYLVVAAGTQAVTVLATGV
jgi:hypothetical protein